MAAAAALAAAAVLVAEGRWWRCERGRRATGQVEPRAITWITRRRIGTVDTVVVLYS